MGMVAQTPTLHGPPTQISLDPEPEVTMAVQIKTGENQMPKLLPNFGWIPPPILLLLTFLQLGKDLLMALPKGLDLRTALIPFQETLRIEIKNLNNLEIKELGITMVNLKERRLKEMTALKTLTPNAEGILTLETKLQKVNI